MDNHLNKNDDAPVLQSNPMVVPKPKVELKVEDYSAINIFSTNSGNVVLNRKTVNIEMTNYEKTKVGKGWSTLRQRSGSQTMLHRVKTAARKAATQHTRQQAKEDQKRNRALSENALKRKVSKTEFETEVHVEMENIDARVKAVEDMLNQGDANAYSWWRARLGFCFKTIITSLYLIPGILLTVVIFTCTGCCCSGKNCSRFSETICQCKCPCCNKEGGDDEFASTNKLTVREYENGLDSSDLFQNNSFEQWCTDNLRSHVMNFTQNFVFWINRHHTMSKKITK